jgi:hypothetical protein
MIHFVAVVSHKNLSRASILRDSVTVSLMNADCGEGAERGLQENWQKNGWQKDKKSQIRFAVLSLHLSRLNCEFVRSVSLSHLRKVSLLRTS